MKIVVVSECGFYLPVAWREQCKDNDISVYIHNQRFKTCYDGILPKLTIQQLKSAAKSADEIVIDGGIPDVIKSLLPKNYIPTSDVTTLKWGHKEQNDYFMDGNLGISVKAQMGFVQYNQNLSSAVSVSMGHNEYYAAKTLGNNEGFGVYQVITIPPYPYVLPRLRQQFAEGIEIEGKISDYPFLWMRDVKQSGRKLICAGTDGVIGIATAWGATLVEAVGRLYHNIGKIKVKGNLQYRTDFLKHWRNYA